MSAGLDQWVTTHEQDLIAVRRLLHQRPELGREEHETTALLMARLSGAGLSPTPLGGGTGVVCDIGTGDSFVVLRADIDALPLQDEKAVAYRSQNEGICHACGHDVHTAVVLGAGLYLATCDLPGRVRLIFQPAEELMPGGALEVMDEGWIDGAAAIFGLHCDPSLAVGHVGLKSGAITAAADALEIRLTGPGGHTSRPHATVDIVHALSTVATALPDALSRLVDPRAGLCLVWGHVAAGRARNAIPREGVLAGTLRVLDHAVWQEAPELVNRLVQQIVAPYGAVAAVRYERGVPPVVNDPSANALLTAAVTTSIGPAAAVPTQQSLGGEDFGWFLEKVPGAMARLGVRGPAEEQAHDLHQPTFDVDETSIAVGVRVLATAALAALETA